MTTALALARTTPTAPTTGERITAWLRRTLELGAAGDLRIVLRVETGGRLEGLSQVRMPPASLEAVGAALGEYAEEDARARRGEQLYAVLAYEAAGGEAPIGRLPLRLAGGIDDGIGALSAGGDVASQALNARFMQHTEVLLRAALGSQGLGLQYAHDELSAMRTRIRELEEGSLKILKLREKLLDRQASRDIATRKVEAEERRDKEMFEKISLLLPVVANKIAGKTVFPEGIHPTLDIAQRVMRSIDESQMERLAGILRPEQTAAVMELWAAAVGEQPLEATTAAQAAAKAAAQAGAKE